METMTDLTQVHTDDLVREMERRLEEGTVGFAGLYSSNQIMFREAWTSAMDLLHDLCNGDFDKWNPHRQLMIDVLNRHEGDRVQNRRRVFALNTTQLGRESEYQ
jgi:hypothetical protein